jgi:hypothetical protein
MKIYILKTDEIEMEGECGDKTKCLVSVERTANRSFYPCDSFSGKQC